MLSLAEFFDASCGLIKAKCLNLLEVKIGFFFSSDIRLNDEKTAKFVLPAKRWRNFNFLTTSGRSRKSPQKVSIPEFFSVCGRKFISQSDPNVSGPVVVIIFSVPQENPFHRHSCLFSKIKRQPGSLRSPCVTHVKLVNLSKIDDAIDAVFSLKLLIFPDFVCVAHASCTGLQLWRGT